LQNFLEGESGGSIISASGLYALSGFERTLEMRPEKYIRTAKLFKRAMRYAAGLRHLPYVRAAAVSGSTAQVNAGPDSDIDLFIIVAPRHVYTARFLVSAYFQLLGMRRYSQKIPGRFCLNHYVAESMRLPGDHTIYTASQYSSFLSLFGASYIRDFWRKNLDWISDFLLSSSLPEPHAFEHSEDSPSWVSKLFEVLLFPASGILEKFLRWLQKRRIRESQFVVVSEQELAFHPESKGQRILARYEAILSGLVKE
ncbi:MAG: nucleotidyltransferase domain-containing protein, partial [Patescibacteria group bacterium]|nr:nucleotidyltransferase domain-containing protein [Patescibacteria group bacterium]